MTLVTFLLDRTGSMGVVREATITGFNEYLESLVGEDIRFTLVQFDSSSTDVLCANKPVAEVLPLTHETYQPRASTPLYDAACKTIDAVQTDDKVIFVILTDGQDNCSRAFTHADLAERVRDKTAAGWQFVFLGAGIDAYAVASSLGISRGSTMSYNKSDRGTRHTFGAVARNTGLVASGAAATMDFSDDQKAAAGDPTVAKPAIPAVKSEGSPSSLVPDLDLSA
jgi:hypothetical protein